MSGNTPILYPGRNVGATTLLQLLDFPDSYIGEGLKFLQVKPTEDGVRFVAGSGSVAWGAITGTLADQTDLDTRFNTIENKVLYYEIFESIASTSGTVTKPTSSTIILNRYEAAGDALIVELDAYSQPIDEPAREADGTIITTTFDVGGNYSLSGTPDSANVAIIYQISIKLVDSGNVNVNQIVNSFEIINADKVDFDNSTSGLTAVNVQDALDEIDGILDVTPSGGVFADNSIIRGDGGSYGIQDSGPTINDTGEIDMQSQKITSLLDPTSAQDAATKEYVDQSVSFIETYFFNNTASDIGGIYYKMLETPTEEGESTFTAAGLSAGDDQALTNWATDANIPGINTLKAGVYTAHCHAERTVGLRTVNLYFEIYTRTSGGAETLRSTSEISDNITSKTDVDLHATISSDVNINTTDRIIIKWYANIGAAGSDVTVVLYAEGTNASRLEMPTTTEILSSVFVRQDGTKPLTADWDAGSFKITAEQLESDVTTGTAPLIIASTTLVSNLNADLLDSQEGSYYLDSANFTGTNWSYLTDAGDSALHYHSTDRARANHTGTQTASTISDFGTEVNDQVKRIVTMVLLDDTTDTSVKDGIGDITFTVPIELNGWDLTAVAASVEVAGTTGTTDIQIYNVTQTADMLTTKITIDSGELTSYTAATPPVIDTANDDVSTGDQIRIDLDAISTTAAKGLQVKLTFTKP